METTALKVSRREQAKSERRARIVDAARSLLREVGGESLSLRDVAERAGVSLATVYNLFSSKEAVLAGVYRDDVAAFESLAVAGKSTDALDRVFDAIDLSASLLDEEPGYFGMIMWGGLGNYWSLGANHDVSDARLSVWRRLVSDALAAGFLKARTDPDVVAALMVQSFSGAMADRVSGQKSVDRFTAEAKLGFAAILSLFATPAARARLRARADQLQSELSGAARG